MSTKIYNGYRILGSSLDEVITKLFSNKDNFKKIIEDKIQLDILSRVISTYHDLCFSSFLEKEKSKDNPSAFSKVISEALERETDSNLREHETVDVSICFFPQKQNMYGQDYYLMMLFAGNESKLLTESELWKDLGIEEFAYWDNTDPLETLTEEEWETRGKQWNKVLGYASPAESSLILELKKEYKYRCTYFMDKESLIKMFEENFQTALSKFSEREEGIIKYYEESLKDKMAYKILMPKYLKNKELKDLSKEEQQKLYYEVRDISRHDKFNDDEKAIIEDNLNKIKKVIKEPITFEDLFENKDVLQERTKKLLKTKKLKFKD